ncbi:MULTISPECIES: hypothetical protein [Halorussus]|uniref:hypothetical protein n=1 Tax=Halorussus TaxID=1070314 RepID=UPI000E21969C|nr:MULTISPECIES: hypothetical protein [Halorussus]NHN57921.1 hypothetical protein [Halorussus sp. JP-T4]
MSTSNSLFAASVLTVVDETATTTGEFEDAVGEYATEFEGCDADGLAAAVRRRVDDEEVAEQFAALGAADPRTVAELCALADRVEATEDEEWLQLLPPLRLFRDDDVRAEGAPDPFVPVPADHLPKLTRVYSPSVVYAWLDDSRSCELARRDLEEVFAEPREVMPFAVYGPAHREFLEREYDLTAGPALLFVRDGTVEARLYGAHGTATVEAELERHCA